MKKILIGVGIAFAVLVIIGIAVGGEEETAESPTAVPTVAPIKTKEPIETEEPVISESLAKEFYLAGCFEDEEEYRLWCECGWDAIVAEFGYKYVLKTSRSGTDEEISEMSLVGVLQCFSLWPE